MRMSATAPPLDVVPGTHQAQVTVMYFGRLVYSESVPIRILASKAHG
jgi:hypothetical protein